MKKDKKLKEALRKSWGKSKKTYFNFDLIKEYYEAKKQESDIPFLTDKSLHDLDIEEFFQFIDRTISCVGQQYLYSQIMEGNPSVVRLKEFEKDIQFYDRKAEQRLRVQQILHQLSTGNDYYFPFLIYSELPPPLSFIRLIQLLQIVAIIGGLAAFLLPAIVIPLIFLFAINMFLHFWHKDKIGNFAPIFSRITKLIKTAEELIPLTNKTQAEKTTLKVCLKKVKKTTAKILLLKTDNLSKGEFTAVAWYLIELLKVLTLFEVTSFHALIKELKVVRKDVQQLFELIGQTDMAISIASLRTSLPYYSIPEFIAPKKGINLQAVYHPLVTNCVANDLHLVNKSLLLTGSNMSGKSTFIKAINLNVIASQVLNTSFTKSYVAPFIKIATSIHIQDDLMGDTSYYMAEVDSIGNLLTLSEQTDMQYLFTIDEVFKGTNTIERISAAKAILDYLTTNKLHLVLVSTHDIELTQLLQDQFNLYYFQESIEDSILSFDYKLKAGALKKRNAINILALVGYPDSIIKEAKELSLQFEREKMSGNNI